MEDFFEAVDRAFMNEASRVPAPRSLELRTPEGLPLSELESPPSAPYVKAVSSVREWSSARASLLRYFFPAQKGRVRSHKEKK